MGIANELKELQQLRDNGTLTQEEFEIAKQRVLEGTSTGSDYNSHDTIELQNEIAQLDREWALERENYMVAGRYGIRYLPSRTMSVISGVAVVGFGAFWTMAASSMTGFAGNFDSAFNQGSGGDFGFGGFFQIFPLFGICFILFGLAMSIYGFVKAEQYQQAYRRYQQRRGNLMTNRKQL